MRIRPFKPDDEAAVVALWEQCGFARALMEHVGYAEDDSVSLGKRLIADEPA